jgi:hypothetical protein
MIVTKKKYLNADISACLAQHGKHRVSNVRISRSINRQGVIWSGTLSLVVICLSPLIQKKCRKTIITIKIKQNALKGK